MQAMTKSSSDNDEMSLEQLFSLIWDTTLDGDINWCVSNIATNHTDGTLPSFEAKVGEYVLFIYAKYHGSLLMIGMDVCHENGAILRSLTMNEQYIPGVLEPVKYRLLFTYLWVRRVWLRKNYFKGYVTEYNHRATNWWDIVIPIGWNRQILCSGHPA